MVSLKDSVYKISRYFTDDFYNPRTKRFFFKALIFFTLVKITMLWSFSRNVMSHHTITLPRSLGGKILLAPAFLANQKIDIFLAASVLFLWVVFFVRPNYIIAILFFWLTFNLYIVFLPFANGADLVLFMLALWCIPMAGRPFLKSETGMLIQKASCNMGSLLCQLQVVFIYLISGWDKLLSEIWRSGEAFDYIIHLNTVYNPMFTGLFESDVIQWVLSWITILFELAFSVLIWIKKTRLLILGVGVIFHLFIGFVISLPDFAAIMILSYVIFLKDVDLALLQSRFKR